MIHLHMLQTRRVTALLAAAWLGTALTASAQTPVTPDRNNYTPEQDVELGQQAAAEVRKQLPMLDDRGVQAFVDGVGRRLVASIPSELEQPVFRYSFEVVNLREINAFALPGGPMFLHRGMLEAAGTEGEIAGVMAHELAHVVLRHGTAQATKGQRFQLGALAGQVLGAIVGGTAGTIIAEGSSFGLGAYFLKYSREYEREADLLGAQIMARAGYDPRQMANMFQTIERQGGRGGPEWLSSHPNPGNRYEAINSEAAMLQVEGRAGSPAEFQAVQARLREMPAAPTAEQVARTQRDRQERAPAGTPGRAGAAVEPPAAQWRTHQPGDFLRINVPANWRQMGGQGSVTYAPEGGYFRTPDGLTAFTHGVQVGIVPGPVTNLQQATDELIGSFARANPRLRREGRYQRTNVGGRAGLVATLTNVSEATGQQEYVQLSTAPLADGSMLFIVGVAPRQEARTYQNTFARVRQSVQIADGAGRR
jgi:beta-barrel assembly-enhancing protease